MNRYAAISILMPVLAAASTDGTPTGEQYDRSRQMHRANLDGVQLDYEVRGVGDPVILVHAGVFGDWFKPLMEEPALNARYRLVRYHRAGYRGSSHMGGPVSIADHARHLRALMGHLGIDRAHIVGHSSSGNIALQLALDAPDKVHSLALLEPALIAVSTGEGEAGQPIGSALQFGPVLQRYRAGDKAGAVDAFLQGVAGPTYRADLDNVLPGAFGSAVADADTFFGQELPAVTQWQFSRDDARRITQPVLAVLGARSSDISPIFARRHRKSQPTCVSLMSDRSQTVDSKVERCPSGLRSTLGKRSGPATSTRLEASQDTRDQRLNASTLSRDVRP
jgi:pimeloyl-ACP methyl ester carboxylesterase